MNATVRKIELPSKSRSIHTLTNLAINAADGVRSSLSATCQLLGIADVGMPADVQFCRRRVAAGRWIFGGGEKFDSLFIVHTGFIKTMLLDEAGNEQILHFPMRGDLLGIDGLHANYHSSQAVALSDCELIVIPFGELIKLAHQYDAIQTWFYSALSRELAREYAVVSLLGTLGAEARVARFLVSLSARFEALGHSPTHFNLVMTRQEIGCYLGLTLETVSRALSALHEAQLIAISQRSVVLNDIEGLRVLKKLIAPTKLYSLNSRASSGIKASLNTVKVQHVTADKKTNSIWSPLAST
jgi:CRP/FNR family transcriptional regulator, anaerobic regulatory protein